MPLAKEEKSNIIKEFGENEKDSGSTKSQIAMLTKRIKDLSDHCQKEPKDHHSRRGLLKLVGQRKRLLKYLQNTKLDEYRALIEKLNIRH
jgi:small subunit ribosomal protein S15